MIDDLLTAVMTKTSGSTLSGDLAGRIFLDEAPEGAEFPYCVFRIVSDVPEYPSNHTLEDLLLQFSLYSISASAVEIGDLLTHLRSLFDDCSLTISGNTLVYFIRGNLTPMVEDITTPAGTASCKHWAQEYSVMTTN